MNLQKQKHGEKIARRELNYLRRVGLKDEEFSYLVWLKSNHKI